MKVEQFFARYANTPLIRRFTTINCFKHGLLTLNDVYAQIHALEDKMRPMRIEQDKLIKIAEEFYETYD